MANKKTKFTTFFDEVKQKDVVGIKEDIAKITNRVTMWQWINGTYEPNSRFWSALNDIAKKYGYEPIYTL